MIKEARLARGMHQDELAELAGYKDKSSISLIENGKADIPREKVIAIANILNIPIIDFFSFDEPAKDFNVSLEEQKIIESFRNADKNTQLLILFALKLQEGEDGKI